MPLNIEAEILLSKNSDFLYLYSVTGPKQSSFYITPFHQEFLLLLNYSAADNSKQVLEKLGQFWPY